MKPVIDQRSARIADEAAERMREILERRTPEELGWPGLTADELIASEWRASFDQERRNGRLCEHCGKRYEPQRSSSRFCSQACKQQAYRRRVSVTASVTPAGELPALDGTQSGEYSVLRRERESPMPEEHIPPRLTEDGLVVIAPAPDKACTFCGVCDGAVFLIGDPYNLGPAEPLHDGCALDWFIANWRKRKEARRQRASMPTLPT